MTSRPAPNRTPADATARLQAVAAVAAIAADFLRLAARTGITIESLPAGPKADDLEQAVQDAADAAWYAASLMVEARPDADA